MRTTREDGLTVEQTIQVNSEVHWLRMLDALRPEWSPVALNIGQKIALSDLQADLGDDYAAVVEHAIEHWPLFAGCLVDKGAVTTGPGRPSPDAILRHFDLFKAWIEKRIGRKLGNVNARVTEATTGRHVIV
jgi:hypothetical protein